MVSNTFSCQGHFPSAWRTTCNISYRIGRLALSFPKLCLKCIYFTFIFKGYFSGYRTLGWQLFPFGTVSGIILSPFIISVEKPTAAVAAAAAKSLQSCLTLCDPIDGSPPGSPVRGILQARIPEWVAISFSTKAHYQSYYNASAGNVSFHSSCFW